MLAHIPLSWIDLAVIVLVLGGITAVGLYFTKKGSQDMDAFFVSGRSLPWYIAGSSMIATSFAADTPLWVTNLVRLYGVHYIWQFWAPLIGATLAAVYFGRKWRRMGFVTDIEFLETRYHGAAAKLLRGWSGLFGALVLCPLISGWVIKAMETISREALGLPEDYRLVVTCVVVGLAILLCTFSGLFGVVYTDFIQLILATVGTLLLAFFAVQAVGGLDAMVTKLNALENWGGRDLQVLPSIGGETGQMSPWNALGYFGLLWIGVGTSGGHQAQRLLASRNSLHASYAQLLHSVIYYALMAWPWIIVALCSLLLIPDLGTEDHAAAYPRMIVNLMPIGLKGLLLAAMLAAFISTISTLFNWGSSYLVNDIYRRFLNPNATQRNYVLIARVTTLLIAVAGAAVSIWADNIQQILTISYVVGSGGAILTVLRWLWWRLNGVGDLAGLFAGWLLAWLLLYAGAFDGLAAWSLGLPVDVIFSSDPNLLGARMLFMAVGVTCVVVVVTYLTPPESEEVLKKFLLRARPFALGWRPVIRRAGVNYQVEENLPRTLCSWGIAASAVVCLLTGIGQLLFASSPVGILLVLAFLGGMASTILRMRADYARELELQEAHD